MLPSFGYTVPTKRASAWIVGNFCFSSSLVAHPDPCFHPGSSWRTTTTICSTTKLPLNRVATFMCCDDNTDPEPSLPLPQAPPYMTAREVTLRHQELEFLAELDDQEEAIHKLRLLWYSERGPIVEKHLRQAWQYMGHPDNWEQAEALFCQVIHDTDSTYLFPFVLLAKLYCLQGRFDKSKILCETVLKFKPYHPSALETIIAATAGLAAQDPSRRDLVAELRHWTSQQLPKNKVERKLWVEWAAKEAKNALEEGKKSNEDPATIGSEEGIVRDAENDKDSTFRDTWQ